MDELLGEFVAETREMLAAIGNEVVAWEAAPHDRARLDAIFRFVHTVKGNSGFFDLPSLTAVSHAAEDALAEVRSGRREADSTLVGSILTALDRIGALIDAAEKGEQAGPSDEAALIAALAGGQAPAPAAVPGPERRAVPRSVRISVELLDRMMNGVSDLVLARNALSRQLRHAAVGGEAGAAFERLSAFVGELRDAVSRTRMQRLDTLFAPLPRLVRDLAAEAGKEVALELEGGEVELDRELVETIRDPLIHLLRNAVAHGIEPPAERAAAGKARAARLRIQARQAGNQIVIEVSDDGRGIDCEAVAAKAVASGILAKDRAKALGRAARTALIFEPGLSTAAATSELSGRGVGLDVVRANVERIGGRIEVESEPGRGACFALRVPLTLSIMPGLIVETAGQALAIPRSAVEEIVRTSAVLVERLGGASVAMVRGRRFPVLTLVGLVGQTGMEPTEPFLVLVRTVAGASFALAVDAVHDEEELVVKPASPAVTATGLYAGTTLSDEGLPILLLDPAGIAAVAGVAAEAAAPEPPAIEAAAEERPALLFTSLCGARRAVALGAVQRIEEVASTAVHEAAARLYVKLGDRLVPLAGCAGAPIPDRLKVLCLCDGRHVIAYAAVAVAETCSIPADVVPAGEAGELLGVALVGGEPAELLDLHRLFESSGAPSRSAVRRRCVIAGDPGWAETFLRPLVESAGYEVVDADAKGAPADVVILLDACGPAPEGAARILKLRRTPEPEDGADTSIHCYDRGAILRALAGGKG